MTTETVVKKNAWIAHLGTFLVFAVVGAGAALGLRAIVGGGSAHGGHAGMDHSAHEEPSTAAEPEDTEPAPSGESLFIDLGNENCPVMGGGVDGETYTEWNGLLVGHCCPGCTEPLLENPEKILDDAGIEWREAAAAAERLRNATGDERQAVLAEIRKKWKVVSR
jgi:hypothetical protein